MTFFVWYAFWHVRFNVKTNTTFQFDSWLESGFISVILNIDMIFIKGNYTKDSFE